MTNTISVNKHEYNQRRVLELNKEILKKESELKNTKGFINKIKIKLELRKLFKEINIHGEETLQFETSNSSY